MILIMTFCKIKKITGTESRSMVASGFVWRKGIDYKGTQGNSFGETLLYLEYGVNYMAVCFRQNG